MDKKKILIVDDEKDILETLSARLKANGYDVTVALDGVRAVSVAQAEKPDLILLDIGLPAGDGYSVMERISFITPLAMTPIIVITALDPVANRQRVLQAGAKAFFLKPVDTDKLLDAIKKALE